MFIKFLTCLMLLYNLNSSYAIVSNQTKADDTVDLILTHGDTDDMPTSTPNKCTVRLHSSLEKLRKRQAHLKSSALIDLSGYALHQTLRHAPLDMYVTDLKVRAPGIGDWVRVQKCQFSNRDNRVTTQILFNDLTVSGAVKLFDENVVLKNPVRPEPSEFCTMSMRLRRAGLGINVFPTRGRSNNIEVRTEARFVDPNFLSVHAYGCKLNEIFKRKDNLNKKWPNDEDVSTTKSFNSNDRYAESDLQYRQLRHSDYSDGYIPVKTIKPSGNVTESLREDKELEPEIRIVSLGLNLPNKEDDIKNYDFYEDSDKDINEYHRERILTSRFNTATEKEKLKAVLHMKNLIAQQANQVFQAHGPFSQFSPVPPFPPNKNEFPRPSNEFSKPYNEFPRPPNEFLRPSNGFSRPPNSVSRPVSSITELDENLKPIGPVQQKPFEALFSNIDDKLVNFASFQPNVDDLSREMEDVFLRGVKTLLTKYLEKQLEIPLKEALMVNIGYTVSYG